jgi:hypothetical protein
LLKSYQFLHNSKDFEISKKTIQVILEVVLLKGNFFNFVKKKNIKEIIKENFII